ncbi:adenylosuccinate lyase [Prosthecobacter fusiformis]|uniref:Adenylosuccinate lyase n=1 Tax=Prosthecobacter fusiformis TaxID=48464 RepID=A0A4R7RMR5_9BACT|nr:adenylosuccinate lyase [Prosthecobacter fusiformis]TDU64274.1 adenylosuccinate lyase [Prosthecobacter fusiformis]
MTDAISNVLAERYATPAMRALWSGEGKVKLERDYWIAVLKGQRDLGIPVPDGVIESYENVKDQVNLTSIMERERVTRHDVKARIEEFCDLAGHEHIHKGMTSRDLTENVEQLQVFRALLEVRKKSIAALSGFAKRAAQCRDIPMTARTHNVAAQVTTLGKRIAMFGEEMLIGVEALNALIASYPARGLKGAVGTRLDQITLFNGDASKARALEDRILHHLGISASLDAVGQVYPRSLDLQVVSTLTHVASGAGSFAKTLRLMAGHELASEGFAKGQVGSSAMPHKMNSRSCERINGFHVILKGYLAMAAGLAGDQWNEGDVSCSVVRRVMLPDAFLAMDGLLETLLTVLNQMEVFEAVVEQELMRYLPFLLTTTVLMEAVKAGAGREAAHEAIKEHAVAVARDMRTGKVSHNDLLARLAADERLGLKADALDAVVAHGKANSGDAPEQVDHFVFRVCELVAQHPEAAGYEPGSIL